MDLSLARKKPSQALVVEDVCCPASSSPISIPAISSSVSARPSLRQREPSQSCIWSRFQLFSIAIYTAAFTISSNVLTPSTLSLPTVNREAKDLRVGRRKNRGRERLFRSLKENHSPTASKEKGSNFSHLMITEENLRNLNNH